MRSRSRRRRRWRQRVLRTSSARTTSSAAFGKRIDAQRIPPHHDPSCWGCGDNPHGLRLPVPQEEGADRYRAVFSFGDHHQAGPGLVHGGLVGAALDEACGLLATWFRFPAVTARIFVRYRRPVAINRELEVESWVTGSRGRRIHVDAELRDRDEVLAEARGAFLHVPLEHFLATPEGRAAREAWQRRLGSTRG